MNYQYLRHSKKNIFKYPSISLTNYRESLGLNFMPRSSMSQSMKNRKSNEEPKPHEDRRRLYGGAKSSLPCMVHRSRNKKAFDLLPLLARQDSRTTPLRPHAIRIALPFARIQVSRVSKRSSSELLASGFPFPETTGDPRNSSLPSFEFPNADFPIFFYSLTIVLVEEPARFLWRLSPPGPTRNFRSTVDSTSTRSSELRQRLPASGFLHRGLNYGHFESLISGIF